MYKNAHFHLFLLVCYRFIISLVPAATETLSFVGNAVFTLPKNIQVSWLISELEKHKQDQRIKDYAFSQTTLEDVFLNIIAETEDDQQTK